MNDMKRFFNLVRPLFRGTSMDASQVAGLTRIVQYGLAKGYPRSHIAYALATGFHETGQRMQPVREGFCTTDAGSRRAVAGLHRKGIISTNYAKPINGRSYYGRGDVQITWLDNYQKFSKILGVDLVGNPDLALDPATSVRIMYEGMSRGSFRKGRSFDMLPSDRKANLDEFKAARDMINGDVRKNGMKIAIYASTFYDALETAVEIRREPHVKIEPIKDIEPIAPQEGISKWLDFLNKLRPLFAALGALLGTGASR